jgi:hypothetical protein
LHIQKREFGLQKISKSVEMRLNAGPCAFFIRVSELGQQDKLFSLNFMLLGILSAV